MITLTYSQTADITNLIKDIQLDIAQSSGRRRFIRTLSPNLQDFQADAEDLRKKYCIKDAKGVPVLDDKKYTYTSENRRKFNTDFETLSNNAYNIKVDETNQKDIETVKDILTSIKDKISKNGTYNTQEFEVVSVIDELVGALTVK